MITVVRGSPNTCIMIQTRPGHHVLASSVLTVNYSVPDPPINTAYLPSEVKAKHYLYGFPSKPLLVARSNPDVWMKPTGMEAYLDLRKRTSSLRSARAARRISCLWGRPRSRAAAKQSSLRLLIGNSTSTSSTGVWRLLRRWRMRRKLRWRKLTLRTTSRGGRRPLRLIKSCSTTSPGTERTKLY